jgi:maltooligosyltrehalose synthase
MALASGELGLSYKGGEFNLTYAEQRYPLNVKSVSLILESGNASQVTAVKKRLSALKNSPSVQDITEKIAGLSKSDQELLHDYIQSAIKQINKDKALLHRRPILPAQFLAGQRPSNKLPPVFYSKRADLPEYPG